MHSSESLEDIIREENIDDYVCDTVVEEGETPQPATSASCEPSCIAPNPLPERSTARTLTAFHASTTLYEPIITNKLDEHQQRYIEVYKRARRLSRTLAIAEAYSDYHSKPLSVDELLRKFTGQPLTTWPTGREATTPEDIAERDDFIETYLTPETTTISEYQIKLTEKARGASVPTQRTILVVLYPGESEAEDDSTFTRWARRFPNMNDLRASASKADVWL